MPYASFHELFPKVAERETRTITVPPGTNAGVPPGEYGFVEMFCDERGCDCRRVFFAAVSAPHGDLQAVIAYGWESPAFYAKWMGDNDPQIIEELRGPCLNLASHQSAAAPAFLNMVRDVLLRDAAYMERVKRHYQMFREKIDGAGSRKRRFWTKNRKRRKKR